MTYDPNIAPKNQEELTLCVNHYLAIEQEKAENDSSYIPKSREELEKLYSIFLQPEMPEMPEPTFEELKQEKMSELGAVFYTACQNATVEIDGIECNADEKAYRNVDGLIKKMEAEDIETAMFCALDNKTYELTYDQIRELQLRIIEKGQYLYTMKWQFREQIESAKNKEELDAIEIRM